MGKFECNPTWIESFQLACNVLLFKRSQKENYGVPAWMSGFKE